MLYFLEKAGKIVICSNSQRVATKLALLLDLRVTEHCSDFSALLKLRPTSNNIHTWVTVSGPLTLAKLASPLAQTSSYATAWASLAPYICNNYKFLFFCTFMFY